jgi:hypothetical protein
MEGSEPPVARLSATPQALEARALPEEAGARTQYDSVANMAARAGSSRPAVTGASTDLAAVSDTAVAVAAPAEKRRSPMIFVLPALALVGIGCVAFALTRDKHVSAEPTTTSASKPPHVETASTSTSTSTSINITLPPPSATVIATASAAPSASASARPTVRPTTSPPPPSAVKRPFDPLDTTIKTQ